MGTIINYIFRGNCKQELIECFIVFLFIGSYLKNTVIQIREQSTQSVGGDAANHSAKQVRKDELQNFLYCFFVNNALMVVIEYMQQEGIASGLV